MPPETATATAADDRYFGIVELAEHTSLSEHTIRRHIAARRNPLPHYRVGRRIIVRKSEFDAWVQSFGASGVPAQPSEASIDTRVARALARSKG